MLPRGGRSKKGSWPASLMGPFWRLVLLAHRNSPLHPLQVGNQFAFGGDEVLHGDTTGTSERVRDDVYTAAIGSGRLFTKQKRLVAQKVRNGFPDQPFRSGVHRLRYGVPFRDGEAGL